MRGSTFFSLAASAATAAAQLKGFNYGSTNTDSSAVTQSLFESLFTTAQNLVGTSGFTAARLYTTIQAGTTDTAIEAIPAAIATNTKLLLGLWGSAGQADFTNELTALSNAITQYGSSFGDLVVGISVGSEDLYRISPTGVQALSGAGAEPATIVDYISQVRSAIAGTILSAAPVGHVDTWTAWVNSTNDAVIDAVDFIGLDAYPYFQNTQSNDISSGASLFQSAYDQTLAAVGSKDIWVTETGWPVSGPTQNLAVASTANAQTYWDDVGCDLLFGKINTFWYTLQDAYPTTPSPSFGIVGTTLSDTPLYNLTCPAGTSGASSSSSSAAASSASSVVSSVASSVAAVSTPSTAATADATSSVVVETPVPSASYASAAVSSSVAVAATTSVVTTASTTTVSGGKTSTVYQTTLVTITSCSSACPTTLTSATAAAASATTTEAAAAASSTAAASSAVASCAANLDGEYQYPHLIVPVSSSSPNTAYGTQYDGTINSTVSTIFNFDIPESYAGKSCELVFLFPELKDLETSSYTFNNQGGLVSHVLAGVANTSTTYANAPAFVIENGAIPSLVPGSSNVISHDTCPGGAAVSFELSSTGGLALEYFQDYNPSPLGLYIVAC